MGSSGCFKDSSTILNKNVTNITGLGQSKIENKNDTIYDYSNGKKFFDNSTNVKVFGSSFYPAATGLANSTIIVFSYDEGKPYSINLNTKDTVNFLGLTVIQK